MKRKAAIFLGAVAILVGLAFCALSALALPGESQVLQTFQAHRQTFQQLSELMLAQSAIQYVGNGTVMINHKDLHPADKDFPTAEYTQYHALLQEAHALAMRRDDTPPGTNFLLGRAGFAGDSVHIGVCWSDQPLQPLVASFGAYLRSSERSHTPVVVYKRIDNQWYLWRDL